ncbi:DEAD/DEAH box helicase [Iamia sp. SCSIO 61187]|nr:DEAD/DEAH box helicase [Iamia sp. SCSIO 61187]
MPEKLVRALHERGLTEPFPIQAATLPDALAGRDVCGRAPTGSGKTLAFGIPLAVRVTNASPKRPKALVLVPTRELAAQVRDELVKLVKPFGRTVHAFYGGVGFGAQVKALRAGVDIVVACPGRLADLIQQGHVRLDRVDMVVLDEADRMADMGFLPEVKRLLDQVMPDRQTLLFSATLDGDVDVLIKRYQSNPVRHGVDKDEDEPVNRHVLWRAERDEKVALTAEIVRAHWPAIVFSRTKHGADRIARQLGKLGVDAVAIHGNRSQGQRERALRDFTSARAQALVATDVAARGIHVDGVACVVHFDAPPDHKDFVHRSGRTGRAGAEGLVVTLTPRSDARDVAKMMGKAGHPVHAADPDVRSLGQPAPVPTRPAPSPDDLAHRPAPSGGGGGGRSGGKPRSRNGRRDDRPERRDDRDRRPAGNGAPRKPRASGAKLNSSGQPRRSGGSGGPGGQGRPGGGASRPPAGARSGGGGGRRRGR